jgi:hypothetical protein
MINLPPSPGQRRTPDGRSVREAAADAGLVLPDVAVLALQQGRVIEAIKLIRTANPGLDLARAKAAMERMQARVADAQDDADALPTIVARAAALPKRHPPTVSMGDPPGQLRWLFVVVALLAIAAWIAFGGGT